MGLCNGDSFVVRPAQIEIIWCHFAACCKGFVLLIPGSIVEHGEGRYLFVSRCLEGIIMLR